MAQFSESSVRAFPCAVALVKGTAVKITAGLIVAATAGTDKIIGVIDVDNDAGQEAQVRLRSASGTAIGLGGAAIAVGDAVTATTAGKLIPTTTAQNQIVGFALEVGADGTEFELMLSTGTV